MAKGFEVLYKSEFKLDLDKVAKVWNHGSVVRSWLLELAERAFKKEGDSESIAPYVADSGEGRWTIQAAMEEDVPVPVIAAALFARFACRDPYNFAARFNAALRNQFGGHVDQESRRAKTVERGRRQGRVIFARSTPHRLWLAAIAKQSASSNSKRHPPRSRALFELRAAQRASLRNSG